MRQQNPSQADAQALLTGFSSTQSLFPRHSLRTWARALWWSIYLLSAFDAGQSRLAQEKLALVPLTSSPTCHFPLVLRVAAVRRDAVVAEDVGDDRLAEQTAELDTVVEGRLPQSEESTVLVVLVELDQEAPLVGLFRVRGTVALEAD